MEICILQSKKKNLSAFFVFLTAFLMFLLPLIPCNSANAAVKSSVIIDAKTGLVLYADNADAKTYPASLTKLMTIYIVFEAVSRGLIDVDQELVVSKNAASKPASKLYLKAGDTITVKEAVLAMSTKSANDAATVVAEAIGGTEEEFAKIMTKAAKQIGMKNTVFKNASGLHEKGQITTARDMAMLGMAMIFHYPQYYYVFSTDKFYYKNKIYYNHNNIMKTFDGADGLKTGFTYASGYNLVTSAQRKNKRLIGVVLGADSEHSRRKKMAKLLNNGFDKYGLADKSFVQEKQYAVKVAAFKKRKVEEMSMTDELKAAHKRFGRLQNIIGKVAARKLANMRIPKANPFRIASKIATKYEELSAVRIALKVGSLNFLAPAAGSDDHKAVMKISTKKLSGNRDKVAKKARAISKFLTAKVASNKHKLQDIKNRRMAAGVKEISVNNMNNLAQVVSEGGAVNSIPVGNVIKGWGVQLASCIHYKNAVAVINRLSDKYSFLRGRQIQISEVMVADMAMYRSRILGLSQSQAKKTCSYLKSNDEACYVLTPDDQVASLKSSGKIISRN
ncbi:MAG: D-alanyl-D-alanine carboxypeptidase [Alphaproteobacteria bacterium]|nr:D-alanyl-D-alanine carboxypeptidase [Alphaproteobacteria bacterium]